MKATEQTQRWFCRVVARISDMRSVQALSSSKPGAAQQSEPLRCQVEVPVWECYTHTFCGAEIPS
eukprot:4272567-Amphidinium_carterae.2